jgi:hypothetical protein
MHIYDTETPKGKKHNISSSFPLASLKHFNNQKYVVAVSGAVC